LPEWICDLSDELRQLDLQQTNLHTGKHSEWTLQSLIEESMRTMPKAKLSGFSAEAISRCLKSSAYAGLSAAKKTISYIMLISFENDGTSH
jgi:hypothetical protein